MAASSTRRHPAELTSDRLADASERWNDKFTGEELDCAGRDRRRRALARLLNLTIKG